MDSALQNTPSVTALLDAAIRFQNNGICAVPVSINGDKRPGIGNWKQYQNRLPTHEEIATWWTDGRQHGIGVITGSVSGNLEALEIEGRAYDAGMLPELEAIMTENGYGDLWQTIHNGYCERSPSGGLHWLYKISDHELPGNEKFASNESGEVLAETRSQGGFMITSPSGGNTHKSGKPYEMVNGSIETIPTITWEQRQVIASAFRLLDATSTNAPAQFERTTHIHTDHLSAGDDFDSRMSWDELLTGYGWTRGHIRGDGTTEWTRPDKPIADGISATTGYIDDRMWVFTSSTILPAGQSLKKWHVYAWMEFGGDFSAAARQLRADGYGDNTPALNPFSALPGLNELPAVHGDVESDDEPIADSWSPVDWSQVMNGTHEKKLPTHLMRTDGVCLFYPNSINQIFGESESGKSLTVAYVIAERIMTFGENALIIDYERDEMEWRERLNAFGCTDEQIRQHVTYVRPEVAPTPNNVEFAKLLELPIGVCVIDSVSASLATFGGDSNSADSVTQWINALARRIVKRTHACVILIDHQAKNKDTRGRFAQGSQAKLATITGAAYEASMTESLGVGLCGEVTLKLAKDAASGVIRQHVGDRETSRLYEAARIKFDSTSPDEGIKVSVNAPNGKRSKRPTALMERTSMILESNPDGVSQNRLYKELGKSKGSAPVELAWNLLATDQYIRAQRGANNGIIRHSIKPYRQTDDPLSELWNTVPPLNPFIVNE